MDNQRFILFIILSVLIMMLWSAWEAEQKRTAPPVASRQEIPSAPEAPGTPAGQGAPAAPAKAAELESAGRVVVETDLVHAEIDTLGGDLRVLDLYKHPVAADKPKQPFRLLNDAGKESFIGQSGLLAREGTLPNHKTRYQAESKHYTLGAGHDKIDVRLNWAGNDGVRVTKIYSFRRNSYHVDVRYEIANGSGKPRDVYLYAQWQRQYEDKGMSLTALPSYTGGVIYTNEKKYEKVDFDSMKKTKLEREAEGGWVAMLQHYFVGAWLPPAKEQHQYYSDSAPGHYYMIGYKTLVPVTVAAGQKASVGTALYAGPKEQARLEKESEGLKLTVDYGWLTIIAAPLFWLLEWLHRLVGNWGWAIILLTIIIKAAFYPLSVASYRSMAQMRKMQPRMQALKERYGDDRQKLNQAMMELYKTEKINPLGGCLPILIQIPVFIALYWVLLESVEMRQAPFALWLKDLSSPDPYYVLPVLMGATMLIQQWLNPQPVDPIQKKLMYALPVVFTGMFLFFPAGLVLYWVVQNILSVAQQWQINRAIEGKAK